MQTLKSFIDQAMMIWSESTGAGRVGIALLLVICVGGVVSVGIWSSQPNYVPLFGDLTPEESGKVVDALAAADIDWQYQGTGSTIVVDKSKLADAKNATSNLGLEYSNPTFEQVPMFGMDPTSQRDMQRRNKEKHLENSIAKFNSVKSAEVLLSLPKRQAFLRETDEPTAAVVIEIDSKTKFGDSDAAAIARLVATSISGMRLENVSLADTDGKVYSTAESSGNVGSQMEYQMEKERELTLKAERQLVPFLGLGNASVAVSTSFSFATGTTVTREVDPDSKMVKTESIDNMKTRKAPDRIGAGTDANIGPSPTVSNDGELLTEKEKEERTYAANESEITQTDQTPKLTKMSVSVVVNKSAVADENGAIEEGFQDAVISLVSNAVGLDDSTDQIAVEFMEFVDLTPVEEEVPVAAIPWDQINQILKNMSLGFAALVALFIALKVLKSFQPGQLITSEPEPVSQASQLSEMVKENPEVFSKIIATWSSLESKPETDLNSKAA